MKKHVLVVGGTGMLKKVSIWLAQQGYAVSVMGRNQERLQAVVEAADGEGDIHPVAIDYRQTDLFNTMLETIQVQRGAIHLVVSWIHSDAPEAFDTLIKGVNGSETNVWRLFRVRGSAAYLSKPLVAIPNHCLYREILLGFIVEESGASRWLTHDEIAGGVIEAIQTDRGKSIVGQLAPWDQHP
ncbi:short-chain dehydrogenase [Pullulanibacillus camelliae]|uniref:Short-chain dehydrogenase n=1 Tax=Pullulanibacillus camelliae TaxID=1707096 RepID=A0A8J2VVG6_9BACL|nr:SDR family NAD(P)-dependent oxidoreductase [Pullulanibacillus camelliae]GGE36841.1 short-chain dehydrogenase [Pullulanibacillus camelliae]